MVIHVQYTSVSTLMCHTVLYRAVPCRVERNSSPLRDAAGGQEHKVREKQDERPADGRTGGQR